MLDFIIFLLELIVAVAFIFPHMEIEISPFCLKILIISACTAIVLLPIIVIFKAVSKSGILDQQNH